MDRTDAEARPSRPELVQRYPAGSFANKASEETPDVHRLVRNANDINMISADQVEHNMRSLGKTEIALLDLRSMPAQLGIFRQPMKAGIQFTEVLIPLLPAPNLFRIPADGHKVRFGAW